MCDTKPARKKKYGEYMENTSQIIFLTKPEVFKFRVSFLK